MWDFRNKAAFVTGGASGIGLALGRAGARGRASCSPTSNRGAGFNSRGLAEAASRRRGIVCDVADRSQRCSRAAARTLDAFGAFHIPLQQTGVGGAAASNAISRCDTWRWVVDVDLMGVVHGIAAFLPRMLAQGAKGISSIRPRSPACRPTSVSTLCGEANTAWSGFPKDWRSS